MKNLEKLKYHQYHIEETNWPEDVHSDEIIQVRHFLDIIEKIDTKIPTMIELGHSNRSPYSKTFNDIFDRECVNICTDILETNMIQAEKEWKENNWNGFFYHGYSGIPILKHEPMSYLDNHGGQLRIKDLMLKHSINILDILHMDIQGSEVFVLSELEEDNFFNNIRYGIISIHDTYDQCMSIINENVKDVVYLFKHPTQGGYGDGCIVYFNPNTRA